MPDGLLDNLSATEIRDLIAYLSKFTQVPLPAGHGAPEQRAGSGPTGGVKR
jgi:hypothetical protein